MTRYMREHEAYLNRMLENQDSDSLEQLREYHLTQIRFFQHERLIHLMVTLAFATFLIIALVVTWLFPMILLFILDALLLITLVFYILHYYRLENTVQRWYRVYNEICEKIRMIK